MTDHAALGSRLRTWVDAGLISADQMRSIADWERSEGRPAKPSVVVEALAYVGGAVIAAALSVITIGYWSRMGLVAQLAIPAAAGIVTVAAGMLVPGHWGDLGVRMRAALWLVPPVATLVVMAVIADRAGVDYRVAMVLQAVPAFVVALALWLVHRTAPQQLAAYAGSCMVVVSLERWAADLSGGWTGMAFAGVAVLWGIGTWARWLPGMGRWASPAGPADTQQRWGWALAAAGAVLGGVILGFGWQTAWTGIIPVALVVTVGVVRSDLVVLIIGAVGTVIVLPTVADHYVNSAMATALVLLVVGAAMVALAIVVARRQARRHRTTVT